MVDHFVHMVEYRLKPLRRVNNKMTILQRPVWLAIGVLLILLPVSGWAWVFAEGYSSAKPSVSARIFYRAFTIYTGQDACSDSPVPFEFRVRPNPITLKVGERIHRTERSELIVEAYDEAGLFLPAVPLVVTVIDSMTVVRSRSDWDYFEAIAEGEAELLIAWYCPADDHVQAKVRILVTAN